MTMAPKSRTAATRTMTLIRIPDLLRDLEILKTTRTTSEEKLREVVLRVVKDAKKAASSYHMFVKKAKENWDQPELLTGLQDS